MNTPPSPPLLHSLHSPLHNPKNIITIINLVKHAQKFSLFLPEFYRKMSMVTEEIRAKAEYYRGNEICQEKSKFLLKEMELPNGLLPLQDIEECGYVKETGFVWLKQKKSITHKFEKIGKLVSYGTEVTATIEPKRIKKLTGVKTKELLIWIQLSDIIVDDPPTGKITFKTPAGLFKTFPVSAFEVEEEPPKDKKEVTAVTSEPAQVKEV